jgi:tetratricopeptide (TPR) repeat protein
MQKATNNNLFNIEAFSLKGETNHVSWHAAFYQLFITKLTKAIYDTEDVSSIGNRLVALADHALRVKQTGAVEQIGRLLIQAPLPRPYQSIGDYYRVFASKRRGQAEQARAGFERLAESPDLPLKFRARAIQALGISYLESGQEDEAVRIFAQATQAASIRYGKDLPTAFNAQSMIAVCRSINGDHQGALSHLESLGPMVRLVTLGEPLARYGYANNLAVELGEVGRLEEARRLAASLVRSPYVHLHPEWRETYDEITAKMRRASPSVIAGVAWPQPTSEVASPPPAATNVVALPFTARPVLAARAGATPSEPARIIAYRGWQPSAPEQPNALREVFTYNDLEQMSIADKQTALLNVIYSDNVTHDTLDELLVAAGKVKSEAPAS